MTELADDIARIAALRGRTPADYAEAERMRRLVSFHDIAQLFGPLPDAESEFRAMERLTPASRQLVCDAPFTLSACRLLAMAERIGEDVVIAAIKHFQPKLVAMNVAHMYGGSHPQAQVEK